jgi:hypothetical protein
MGIRYEPRGPSGYRCEFIGDAGLAVTVCSEAGVAQVEVVPEGLPTQALVGAVERFAEHELGRRRTRNEHKRRHHAKEAQRWNEAAEHVGELLSGLTEKVERGWCSDCLTLADHRLSASRSVFRTRRYVCVECGSPTGWCDVPRCRHFADREGGLKGGERFCAEHGHEIPSFAKLGARVDSLDDYLPWLEFERFNARRFTTVSVACLAGLAVVGPLAFVAAPAIGGAIGSAAWAGTGTLSGAAATSHGLALLGGGAVAAGGYGMMGGTAVVTAVGAGLGGASGASVANAYVRTDDSFGFEKVWDGTGPTVIFANGFLSEGKTGWGGWEPIVRKRYPDATVYRLTWGAKELKSLTSLAAAASATRLTEQAAKTAAAQATRSAGRLLGPLGGAFTAASLAKNPWHVARTRATMTGTVLADAIVRSNLNAVVLIGFSLGGRVMSAAAESLATRHGEQPRIQSMHLLGAAVGTRRDWHNIELAVDDRIWNYWSANDKILRWLYRLGEAGTKAVGCDGIPTKSSKVKNVNVSRLVGAHRDHLRNVTLR